MEDLEKKWINLDDNKESQKSDVINGIKTDDLATALLKERMLKENLIKNLKEKCTHIEWWKSLKKRWKTFIIDARIWSERYNASEGKIVHINIPAVNEFKWFNFDCFVTDQEDMDMWIDKWDFDEKGLSKIAYSKEDIIELLIAIKRYMSANWVEIDENFDYSNLENGIRGCVAADIMKEMIKLKDSTYWLKDIDEDWRTKFKSFGNAHSFQKSNRDYVRANLITKIL